ncbi:hypothetical protein FNE59_20380 [Bacillus thuringiensis]|uniref:hypothetical protein n=1 Tax=Bacillus cereus group TaxID=86661 RepID=UPI0018F5D500|nr:MULTISPECIES: hypothetical protein [Bacillus cereus group]MBJ7935563.1 hypothetical protein [Bacillus cereus]MDR5047872.1 hypothetical protein [Bacillus thuringiensis]
MHISETIKTITDNKKCYATNGTVSIFCNSFGAIQIREKISHLTLSPHVMNSNWEIINEPWYKEEQRKHPENEGNSTND